jgi:hypothetical protein
MRSKKVKYIIKKNPDWALLDKNEENAPPCIYPECTRSSYRGGRKMCPRHYAKCNYYTKEYKMSWEDAVKKCSAPKF